MSRIFITYRRRESAYAVDSLSKNLREHFGPDSVFLDVDNIPLGTDFREQIENAVGFCDVLLVVIGDEWLNIANKQGARRIDDPKDFVRIEIESALKREIPIIPVLIDEAIMPSAAELPESIQNIAYRQAAEFRSGSDLPQHSNRLIKGLENLFKLKSAVQKPIARKTTKKTNPKPKKKPVAVAAKQPKILSLADKQAKVRKTLQEVFGEFADNQVYFGDAIPSDKLDNALISYAPNVLRENVLMLYDNTGFGGAKDGLILTDTGIYWHNLWAEGGDFRYWQIKSVKFSSGILSDSLYINEEKVILNLGNRSTLAELVTTFLQRVSDISFFSS